MTMSNNGSYADTKIFLRLLHLYDNHKEERFQQS